MGDASIGPLVITWPEENHPKPEDWIAVFNAGKRAGAEEMRERAASAAWTALEAVLFKENSHDTVLEDHIADTIRALPLER